MAGGRIVSQETRLHALDRRARDILLGDPCIPDIAADIADIAADTPGAISYRADRREPARVTHMLSYIKNTPVEQRWDLRAPRPGMVTAGPRRGLLGRRVW